VSDLITASIAVGIVALLALAAGWWVGRRGPTWSHAAAMLLMGGLIAVYLLVLRDSVALTTLGPWSALMIYADPLPWVAAFVGGLVLGQTALPWWRRGVLAVAVAVAGWWGPYTVLSAEPPPVDEPSVWRDGVCLQSQWGTCVPAAAATLLRAHGVEASEAEMAELCRTGEDGTHLLGLWRGLVLKGQPAGLEPAAAALSIDDLRDRPEVLPAVLELKLTVEVARREPRYVTDWGWEVGVIHTVVAFGWRPDGRLDIGDPATRRESFTVSGLDELWTGQAVWLERVGE